MEKCVVAANAGFEIVASTHDEQEPASIRIAPESSARSREPLVGLLQIRAWIYVTQRKALGRGRAFYDFRRKQRAQRFSPEDPLSRFASSPKRFGNGFSRVQTEHRVDRHCDGHDEPRDLLTPLGRAYGQSTSITDSTPLEPPKYRPRRFQRHHGDFDPIRAPLRLESCRKPVVSIEHQSSAGKPPKA